MRVSAKTEYACVAMLELAASYASGQPVRIRNIAQRHGVPSRFLVQILLRLKGAGLVASTRGAAGGYRLNRPPEQITLGAILAAIEGQEELTSGAADSSPFSQVLQAVWSEADQAQRDVLAGVTLDALVQRADIDEPMYYI